MVIIFTGQEWEILEEIMKNVQGCWHWQVHKLCGKVFPLQYHLPNKMHAYFLLLSYWSCKSMHTNGACDVIILVTSAKEVMISPLLNVSWIVGWFVCQQDVSKMYGWILMKFFGLGPRTNWLDFLGNPDPGSRWGSLSCGGGLLSSIALVLYVFS